MSGMTATEARNGFAEILGRVTYGKERIAIERRGRPVAALVPIEDLDRIDGRAREALRDSAAALAKAQRLAKIGNWRWSIEGNALISCSEEYARIHGVGGDDIHDLMTHQMERVIHPQDRDRVAEAFRRFDEEGLDYEIEYRIARPDGETRHVLELGETVFDAVGRAVEQVGTVQDITERKRAEEALEQARDELERRVEDRTRELREANRALTREIAERHAAENELRESEERYRRLVELSPDGVFVNCDGRFVFANPAAVSALGADSADDLIGRSILDHVHADFQDTIRKRVEIALETGEALPKIEQVFLRVDGRAFHVETTATPIAYQGKRAVMAVFRDITERKLTEDALRQSEARAKAAEEQLRDAIESLSDAFVLYDAHGRLVLCNDKFKEFYRYSNDEAAPGVHFRDLGQLDVERGTVVVEGQEPEAYIGRRDEFRDAPLRTYTVQLTDGRYLQTRDRRTAAGGVVSIQTDITELTRTEQSLRESEQRFRAVVDNSPAAIFLKDRQGRYLLVNRQYETWFNTEREEILGTTIHDLFPAAVADHFTAHDEEVMSTGKAVQREVRHPIRGGTERDMLVVKFPIHGPGGRIDGLGVIEMDITERKQAEEALRKSERQLRVITDNLPAAIAYIDTAQRYRFVSKVVEAWYARPRDEILGKHPQDILGQSVFDKFQYHIERTLAGESTAFDATVTYPDRITRDVAEYLVPHIGQDGSVEGYFVIAHDISERKRAEEALRESEERLRQATRLAGLGYWTRDAIADRCIHCSEVYARLHGLTVEQYIARSSALGGEFPLTHPEDRAEVKAAYTKLRAGTGFEIEYRVVAPDGEVRHVREIARPVFDRDGAVVREYGTSQDITEKKLAEEQLRQAQKMEAVGQLTGGVAHDFNNLLAVIMGNAELLGDRIGAENRQVQAVLAAAGRGAELTQRLLAFSRRQTLSPRPLALDAVVEGMSDLVRRTLGEKMAIEISAQSGLWPALADPGQLENALLNLAINARDAMPNGGTLSIETANVALTSEDAAGHAELRPGDYVMLSVRDDGTGIAPADLDHVFEPFFTTKEVGQGSGLGLSMVYGFARQSGGHVAIDSAPGRGATVRLYLPRAEESAPPAEPRASGEHPRARGETVLVLEDDPAVRGLAVAVLEDLGYRVLTAPEGTAALAALERAPEVALLLSDVVLPGAMSGPDVAAEAARRRPGLKVLFMSGYAADALIHDARPADGAAVIDKPFRKAALANKVREVLDAP